MYLKVKSPKRPSLYYVSKRTGRVGSKNCNFADVQYCIYADLIPFNEVGGSEKVQNYDDVIYV